MPGIGDLIGRRPEEHHAIPVQPEVKLGYAVYYAPTYPPLSNDELAAKLPAWIAAHVPAPLGTALERFVAGHRLVFNDMTKTALPLPPTDVLRHEGGLGAEEERRFNAAFQLLVISATDPNQVPRFGLWAVLAGSLCAAEALSGVVYDVEAMRMLPLAGVSFPAQGELKLSDHVAVRALTDVRGSRYVSTIGMSKLGLPEVLLPSADDSLKPLVAAAAQALLEAALRASHAAGAPVSELNVDLLTIDPDVAARAGVGSYQGVSNVRLAYVPGSPVLLVPVPAGAPD